LIDWPAPKEAAVDTNTNEDSADKEKFIAPKVKSKGQWKPFTPTIVHASSSTSRSSTRRTTRRSGASSANSTNGISKKPSNPSSSNSGRRGSKTKDVNATTSTKEIKSDKEEEKKPKARSHRPKNSYRTGQRKVPAFVNIDADTLKMYIMQQM
jgi:la-related protein 1